MPRIVTRCAVGGQPTGPRAPRHRGRRGHLTPLQPPQPRCPPRNPPLHSATRPSRSMTTRSAPPCWQGFCLRRGDIGVHGAPPARRRTTRPGAGEQASLAHRRRRAQRGTIRPDLLRRPRPVVLQPIASRPAPGARGGGEAGGWGSRPRSRFQNTWSLRAPEVERYLVRLPARRANFRCRGGRRDPALPGGT